MSASVSQLSNDQYNDLVEAWNRKQGHERAARAQNCRSLGHDWHEVPFSDDENRVLVCVGCLKYDTGA